MIAALSRGTVVVEAARRSGALNTARHARDLLDPDSTRVLEAVPARAGTGPARIAVAAGVDFDTVMRCLGGLAAAGFVERCDRGWRLRR